MASRISEQIIEWLTIGGNAFSSQTSVPLVINKVGVGSATIPTTNGTFLAEYINQGQLWILGAAGASSNVKSSQLIVSSSDSGGGNDSAIELWRGTAASWQIVNSGGLLSFKNDYTSSAQSTYTNTAVTLYYNGGVTDVTYNSRTIKPLMRVFGRVLGTDIESSTFFMNNTSGGGDNKGYYLNNVNINYARLYINAVGTANSGDDNTTVGTIGGATLILGNSTARPASGTAGGANNARGILTLYGTNQYNVSFMADNQAANRSFYIPKLETTAYAVPAYDLSGAQDLNTKYDAGFYCIEGGSVTNYPPGATAYANMIVIPYRKPSGNTVPDYASQIYLHSSSSDANAAKRLWYRGSGGGAWSDWVEVAHIAANTAVGSGTQGVYVTASGVVTAMSYSLSATVNSGTTNHIAYYSGANAISSDPNITRDSANMYITLSTATAMTYCLQNDKYKVGFHLAAGGNRGIYEFTNSKWLLYFPNGSATLTLPSGNLAFTMTAAQGRYIQFTSKENTTSTLIGYNGSNIWIGASQSAIDGTQVYGNVYIHAGLDNATNKYINQTIYVRAGSSATDTSGTTYAITHGTGGSSTQPIYVDSSGRVTTCTSYANATVGYASKLTNITSTDAASSSDVWRRVWFSYSDNTTGRPAYADSFAYQSSTGTMKANNLTAAAGFLRSTANSNTVTIGSQNSAWCHFTNSADIPFYFGNSIGINHGKSFGTSDYPALALYLGGTTNATMTSSSTNPRIVFAENYNLTQPVYLIYTDYDSYRSPAGLKVVGGASASPAWFEVEGDVYGRYFIGDLAITRTNEIRFHKNGFSSNMALYFGYKWADASTSPLITKYIFENCNTSVTDIQFHTAQTSNYGTGAPGSSTHQAGAGSLYFQYIN